MYNSLGWEFINLVKIIIFTKSKNDQATLKEDQLLFFSHFKI